MLGLKGVRNAAVALRGWPGPLSEEGARDMRALFERVRLAGHLAQVIRPAGFDAEMIFLVTLLQNLGRLVVQYHFPDEAQQMRALMRPAPAERPGQADQPGLNEETAALGVFGVDIEAFASAVARHWGLTDEVLHLIRRLNPAAPVRNAEGDDALIRATASCANETVDALALPASRQVAAIEHIAQRYARSLKLTPKDLNEALQRAREGGEPLQANADENDFVDTDAAMPLAPTGSDSAATKPA
jgi:non-specific serine/threonine protein kinase